MTSAWKVLGGVQVKGLAHSNDAKNKDSFERSFEKAD